MNDATPIPTDIAYIPLKELQVSPMNARQDVPAADISALAQSIATVGLLQNLSVYRHPDGSHDVVAGGKRLRALQHLSETADNNTGPETHVPCRITEDADIAAAWAGTENAARDDPHPADEIRAYRDMAATGAPVEQIAAAFAKRVRHVRGRLALAGLPETALIALRKGEITLDEAAALTLATDNDHAERVLGAALTLPNRSGGWIRRELAEGRIPATDRRAVFVGLDTYTAEGGALTEDLFTDASMLHDEALLDRLFATKLAIETERVEQDEGWSWAVAVPEPFVGYSTIETYQRLYKTQGELTEEDMQILQRLTALEEQDALHTASVSDPAGYLADLRARTEGDYTDDDRKNGGVFVYVDSHGELCVSRAFRQRTTEKASSDDTVETQHSDPKPAITAKGTEDLHRIATLAFQAALVDKSDLLLDLLAFQMEAEMPGWSAPMNLVPSPQEITASTEDGITTDARLTIDPKVDGPTPDQQFAAFQGHGKKHRNTVLARHLARTLNAPMRSTFGQFLFAMAGADMRKVWTPTAENFFRSCSVAHLDAIWREVLALEDDDPRIEEFGSQKKGAKAKTLEALFSDASVQEAHGLSRAEIKALDAWVPAEFRMEAD